MTFFDKLEVFFLNLPLKTPFVTSSEEIRFNESLLLKLSSSSGFGWGEIPVNSEPAYCPETVSTSYHIIKDIIVPILKKENNLASNSSIDDWINIFPQKLEWIKGHQFTKGGLDFCFWNLKSNIEQKSLSKLLHASKSKIPVGISIGIESNFEKLEKQIQSALEDNYQRIKIKIEPGKDLNILEFIRKHFGYIPLMVDANSAYTLKDMKSLLKMDKYELLMIEQPLAYDDIIDHATLQTKIETPVCLDESIHSAEDTRKAHSIGACKVINLKPGRVGGITESLKIIDYCTKNKIDLWCGGMLESGIGRIINIALQANNSFTFPGDTSPSNRFFLEDIINPEVKMSQTPGYIDVNIDYAVLEENIEKFAKKKQVFNLQ